MWSRHGRLHLLWTFGLLTFHLFTPFCPQLQNQNLDKQINVYNVLSDRSLNPQPSKPNQFVTELQESFVWLIMELLFLTIQIKLMPLIHIFLLLVSLTMECPPMHKCQIKQYLRQCHHRWIWCVILH